MAPQQKPGKSRQDYSTPPEFLQALKNRLGIPYFECDLAASIGNSVAPLMYTEEDNSLDPANSWKFGSGWSFCNPPYADIRPWVRKAFEESRKGAHVVMLVPASVGSNWWSNWVHRGAMVWFLNGRLTFVGETAPYPKDTAVLLYAPHILEGGYTVWNWRNDITDK